MITYVKGDLFASPARVLVNTVNTVGVMGKGVAGVFKKLYPDMFKRYREMCEKKSLDIGMLYLYKTPNKWILNFPTKRDWRRPSKLEYIEAGLRKFALGCVEKGIYSVAFPPLGCGNGGLDWNVVRLLMEKYLAPLPIDVLIYPHLGTAERLEHELPKNIKSWLHSEPEDLPFNEVWDDLKEVLKRKQTFSTIDSGESFRVTVDNGTESITISSNTGECAVDYDALLGLWQRLRQFKYVTQYSSPPDVESILSYLIPLFLELDYISPFYASIRNGDEVETSPPGGLQYRPPPSRSRIAVEPLLAASSAT